MLEYQRRWLTCCATTRYSRTLDTDPEGARCHASRGTSRRSCRHEASRGCPPFTHRSRQQPSRRQSYLPSAEVAFHGLGLIFANSSTATILALANSVG